MTPAYRPFARNSCCCFFATVEYRGGPVDLYHCSNRSSGDNVLRVVKQHAGDYEALHYLDDGCPALECELEFVAYMKYLEWGGPVWV